MPHPTLSPCTRCADDNAVAFACIALLRRLYLPHLEPTVEAVEAPNARPSPLPNADTVLAVLAPVVMTYVDYMGAAPHIPAATLAAALDYLVSNAASVPADGEGPAGAAPLCRLLQAVLEAGGRRDAIGAAAVRALRRAVALHELDLRDADGSDSLVTNTTSSATRSGAARPQLGGWSFLANPHSHHLPGRRSADAISGLRQAVLRSLGCYARNDSDRRDGGQGPCEYVVVFTSGVTGACRLVGDLLRRAVDDHDIQLHNTSHSGERPPRARYNFRAHAQAHNSVLGIRAALGCDDSASSGGAHTDDSGSRVHYGVFDEFSEFSGEVLGDDYENSRSAAQSAQVPQPWRTLVAFPAVCNFTGESVNVRAAVSSIRQAHQQGPARSTAPPPLVLVDGAAVFGKHQLHCPPPEARTAAGPISDHHGGVCLAGSGVDMFVFGFYKAFGGPTGLGGLVLRRTTALRLLHQTKQPLHDLSAGSICSGGYFGGGAVQFVATGYTPSPTTTNASPLEGGGAAARPAADCPHHALKGPRRIDGNAADGAAIAASYARDDVAMAAVAGLEDGTPHYHGAAEALLFVRLAEGSSGGSSNGISADGGAGSNPVPSDASCEPVRQWLRMLQVQGPSVLLSPASVLRRAAHCAAVLVEGLVDLRYGDGSPVAELLHAQPSPSVRPSAADSGPQDMDGKDGARTCVAFCVLAPPSGECSSGDGRRPQARVSHVLAEELLSLHPTHRIALRGGAFCNPGAAVRCLRDGLCDADILSAFPEYATCGEAAGGGGGGCVLQLHVENDDDDGRIQKSQTASAEAQAAVGGCLDDNAFSRRTTVANGAAAPRPRALGALRVSFGLYSTPLDAARVVAAVVDCFVRPAAAAEGPVVPPATSSPAAVASPPQSDRSTDQPEEPAMRTCLSLSATVVAAFVYPVKGCAGIAVGAEPWPVDGGGFLFDRRWCIARRPFADGATSSTSATSSTGPLKALTPKDNIRLAAMQPTITGMAAVGGAATEGGPCMLAIACPRTGTVARFPIHQRIHNEQVLLKEGAGPSVTVRGRSCAAAIVADNPATISANALLSAELGEPVMLMEAQTMSVGGGDPRTAKAEAGSGSSNFSNSGAFMVMLQSSHEAVLASLRALSGGNGDSASGEAPAHVTIASYRPNIVLSDPVPRLAGSDAATAHQTMVDWQRLRRLFPFGELAFAALGIQGMHAEELDGLRLTRAGPCFRCSQVGVDTQAGAILPQPLATIAALCRRHSANASNAPSGQGDVLVEAEQGHAGTLPAATFLRERAGIGPTSIVLGTLFGPPRALPAANTTHAPPPLKEGDGEGEVFGPREPRRPWPLPRGAVAIGALVDITTL